MLLVEAVQRPTLDNSGLGELEDMVRDQFRTFALEKVAPFAHGWHLKDELMPRYAELVYNGLWFSPERAMLQALCDHSQTRVEGEVRLKLFKGGVHVTGRRSPQSLYSERMVTFEDDGGAYDQRDAEGFIKLNALRLRTLAQRKKKMDL